jgi:hypothetical protein
VSAPQADLAALSVAIAGRTISGDDLLACVKSMAVLLPQIEADIAARDWPKLVDLGVEEAAVLVGRLFPQYALIAKIVAMLAVYARHHPSGTLTPPMAKADGLGGSPGPTTAYTATP